MRLRNDTLRTGYLVSPSPPSPDASSLLLLVAGASDIEPLQRILRFLETVDFVTGIDIADQRRLDSLDPSINASRIVRIEARELAGLSPADIETILRPALERLRSGEIELFPAAGGAVGGVAEGIQFLNREGDLAAIEALIRKGGSVIVRAPRRAGKTSVLRRLQQTLQNEFAIQYLDLQRDRDLTTAAARLHSAVTHSAFRPAIKAVSDLGWERALIQSLDEMQARTQKKALLILDELVFLFEAKTGGEAQTESLIKESLDGLQRVVDRTGVRLLFAGSLDLLEFVEGYLHHSEIPDVLKCADSYPLPSLAESSLTIQLRRLLLGTGLVLESQDLQWFSRNVDISVPYPGQVFLDRLSHELRRVGPIDTTQLDRSLRSFLLETDSFREFESHLKRAAPGRKRSVESAVGRIAGQALETGVPIQEIRLEVPDERDFVWMIETFPLRSDGDRVRSVSRLWWRWWRIQLGIES